MPPTDTYYYRTLPGRLGRFIDFVQTRPPEEARPLLPTLLKLINTASEQPDCRPLAAELVTALHPWPKRWGNWEEWLATCRLAANILGQQGQHSAQGWLLADVVEMLFDLGRYDDALVVWAQLLVVANGAMARSLCRAGHTASTKLILSGRGDEGTAIYEQQVDWLAEWQPHLPEDDFCYAHALVVLQQTLVMRRQGKQQEAIAMIDALRAELAAWPETPPDLWRDLYHHQGGVLTSTADYAGSVAAMEQAITYAVQMADLYYEAALYTDKAIPLWAAGYLDQVETAVRHSLHLYEKLKANWRLVHSIDLLLDVLVMRPALDEALLWLPRQMELTRQLNDEATLSNAHTLRGLVFMQQGKYDLAVADLKISEASCLQRKNLRWLGWIETNLSWCYEALGERETAVTYAQRSYQHSQEANAVNVELIALRCLARFQPAPEKRATLEQAIRLAQQIHSPFNEAACLFDLLPATADPSEQQTLWQQAATLLQNCGVMGWLDGRSPQNPPCLPLIA
jgi:tetratricopeptide (TPR) repeat protein